MKTIFIIAFMFSVGFINAQSKLRPLTDEEIMYSDLLDGTLVSWTTEQEHAFIKDCKSKSKDILKSQKSFCKCTLKSLMTGINYESYATSSDFQKGRLISMHGKQECKEK